MNRRQFLLPLFLIAIFTFVFSCDDSDDGSDSNWQETSLDSRAEEIKKLPYHESFDSTGGRFKCSDKRCRWSSGLIDISGATNLVISADARSYKPGVFENADYLKMQYRIDGGDWVTFFDHKNDLGTQAVTKSVSETGSTMRIRINAKTSAKNETFEVDNLRLVGDVDPVDKPSITMSRESLGPNEDIVINFHNVPGGERTWVGTFRAHSSSTEGDILDWEYTDGAASGTVTLPGLNEGSYVARLFFNDSYDVEDEVAFDVVSQNSNGLPYTETFADVGGSFKCSSNTCSWISDHIDTSGAEDLVVEMIATSEDFDEFEDSDYLKMSYRTDSGSFRTLLNHTGGLRSQTFKKSISDIGKTIQIKLEARTSRSNETYIVSSLGIKEGSGPGPVTGPVDVSVCYRCDFDKPDPECACPGTPECAAIKACNDNPSRSGCRGILQRKAVFDDLRSLSAKREAFALQSTLPLDWEKDSAELEPLFVQGDTELKYFRALFMLNNARRDSHLDISDAGGPWVDVDRLDELEAPIRFLPDYGEPVGSYSFFVIGYDDDGLDDTPQKGDRLLSINGQPIHCVVRHLELYYQSSSYYQSMWHAREGLETWNEIYEPGFLDPEDGLTYELQRDNGTRYTVHGRYRDDYDYNSRSLDRPGGAPAGFNSSPVLERENFALYRHASGARVLYLEWLDFEDDMEEQMEDLAEYAEDKGLLGYDLIIDTTHSSGGGDGVLALRRLHNKSFKATFGNVRVSGASEEFADDRNYGWLEDDIDEARRKGWDYTRSRPFKLDHFSLNSDGIMAPKSPHFQGRTVWLTYPSSGGSHNDQFVAMAIDNQMGHSIGVASPGYSNTWEWEEDYRDPTTGEKLIGWMWNIGHTIRPSGEVLQGNPAVAAEQFPMTLENYNTYYDDLVQRAMKYLGH